MSQAFWAVSPHLAADVLLCAAGHVLAASHRRSLFCSCAKRSCSCFRVRALMSPAHGRSSAMGGCEGKGEGKRLDFDRRRTPIKGAPSSHGTPLGRGEKHAPSAWEAACQRKMASLSVGS